MIAPVAAQANVRCIADPKRDGRLCKTFVDVTDAYQETYHARHEPAALWVACVAVVFASQGHVIQQPRIAKEAYGDVADIAMADAAALAKPLARDWKDDDGVAFRVTAEPLFELDGKDDPLRQDKLIQSLSAGVPVILSGSHPVVLTALAYAGGDAAKHLVAGFVFDPTPMVGPRALDLREIIPKSDGGALHFAVRARLERV